MKIISFIGQEKAYLVAILGLALEKQANVLLLDCSDSGNLFAAFTKNSQLASREQRWERGKMTVIRETLTTADSVSIFASTEADDFEYCLCYSGWSVPKQEIMMSDLIWGFTDYQPKHISLLSELLTELDSPSKLQIILCDMLTEKITDMAIARELEITSNQIVGCVEANLRDQKKELHFLRNGKISYRDWTEDTRSAWTYMLSKICKTSLKESEKMLRKGGH